MTENEQANDRLIGITLRLRSEMNEADRRLGERFQTAISKLERVCHEDKRTLDRLLHTLERGFITQQAALEATGLRVDTAMGQMRLWSGEIDDIREFAMKAFEEAQAAATSESDLRVRLEEQRGWNQRLELQIAAVQTGQIELKASHAALREEVSPLAEWVRDQRAARERMAERVQKWLPVIIRAVLIALAGGGTAALIEFLSVIGG